MPPPDAPEGLWLLHIHHIGEFANSSVIAPRCVAFTSIARWLASAVHFHAEDVGSSLFQSCQKPSICLKAGMLGDFTIVSPPTLLELHAPRL